MATSGIGLRARLHLHPSSTHPGLQKSFYYLCLPSLLAALNAGAYYLRHGEVNWAATTHAAFWAVDTYAAPWVSLLANIAATIVFVMFSRHKRVRSHAKLVMSFALTLAWLGTFLSFLVVE